MRRHTDRRKAAKRCAERRSADEGAQIRAASLPSSAACIRNACRCREPRGGRACHRHGEQSRDRRCEPTDAEPARESIDRFQHALDGVHPLRRHGEQHGDGEQDIERRDQNRAHQQRARQCAARITNLVADVRSDFEAQQRKAQKTENRYQMPVKPRRPPDEPRRRDSLVRGQPGSESDENGNRRSKCRSLRCSPAIFPPRARGC